MDSFILKYKLSSVYGKISYRTLCLFSVEKWEKTRDGHFIAARRDFLSINDYSMVRESDSISVFVSFDGKMTKVVLE